MKLSEKVNEINALLRSFGREAVQETKMTKDGQVIGQIRYGFKPQYVFDAVNHILQPENWRYEVVSKEIFEYQAVVEVKLFVRLTDEWLCKGSQTGQMQIVKNNVGDAYKGAITDAIQKCFSTISIGTDAYRGLLKTVYLGTTKGDATSNTRSRPARPANPTRRLPPQKEPHQNSPQPHANNLPNDLPQIAGVNYQRINDKVIATGNTFDKKNLLKSSGFRWDGSHKNWYKEIAVH